MEFRLDFRLVNVSEDPNSPNYVPIPDPDRYEYVEEPGNEGWADKLDPRGLFFPVEMVADMLKRATGIPLGDLRPLIENSDEYIKSRICAIREALENGTWDTSYRSAADAELDSGLGSKTRFVIASIDLVASTALSQEVDPLLYARVIQTFSREIAQLCALFHGRPLKFMGDGAILFFPMGSDARKHDLAIDCALSLRDLVLHGINSVLTQLSLPILSCRIGLDSGEAYIMTIGDHATTNHVDIVGNVVNIATKIEKTAPSNAICLGESVVLNTHTMWLKHIKPLPLPPDWPYRHVDGTSPYAVFRLDIPPAEQYRFK